MYKPIPECEECCTQIEPFNLYGLCSACYVKAYCDDCDMKLNEGSKQCEWCNLPEQEEDAS